MGLCSRALRRNSEVTTASSRAADNNFGVQSRGTRERRRGTREQRALARERRGRTSRAADKDLASSGQRPREQRAKTSRAARKYSRAAGKKLTSSGQMLASGAQILACGGQTLASGEEKMATRRGEARSVRADLTAGQKIFSNPCQTPGGPGVSHCERETSFLASLSEHQPPT